MNIMFFLSYTLTIGAKFVNSPSYYIINFLKNNNYGHKKDILNYLDKQNLIKERIEILTNENLIEQKENIIYLSKKGATFCNIFVFIKKFFKIQSEG